MTSPYRPEFEAALGLFAQVSEAMRARGHEAPILVGGAAVELYSASAINTGDFDIVTGRQDAFETILQDHGFVRPSGAGMATRGWIHPQLKLGFEVVSSTLLDGQADRERVMLLQIGDAGRAAFIAIEDIIADRMGNMHPEAPQKCWNRRALYLNYIPMPIWIIWNGAYDMKPAVIMASKLCKTDKAVATLEAFGADVARRRTVAGKQMSLPRNSGLRRSTSKQTLLKAIENAGGKW